LLVKDRVAAAVVMVDGIITDPNNLNQSKGQLLSSIAVAFHLRSVKH